MSNLVRMLRLARGFKPELSTREVRKLLEATKKEGQAMRIGDFDEADMYSMKVAPLLDKLFMEGTDKVTRRQNMGVRENLDDILDMFIRGEGR